jgi:hypothetical protein
MAVSFEQCAPFAEFVLGWGLSGSGYHASTGEFRQVAAPFTPVQNGALVYVPVGEGVLVYMGGETPSVADGVNATMAPVSLIWGFVFRC